MNSKGTNEPVTTGHRPNRDRVEIRPDVLVQHNGVVYRILQVLDFETVIGINVETGRSAPLRVGELKKISSIPGAPRIESSDLSEVTDEDWEVIKYRAAAIEPLLDAAQMGRAAIEKRGEALAISAPTLYRWLNRYLAYGEVTALAPMKRGWRKGKARIRPEAEAVIDEVISGYYLTIQRPIAQKAIVEVHRLCLERGIEPPSPGTIRSRIARIPERAHLRGRGFKEKAQNKFTPVPGKFPNATYPLSVVQIDHTPADIIVVDDLYRKPIGRPWLTVAIDVFSRCVVGYYLSFEEPSETSVAMCVAHMILPKEEWLLLHKVDAEWPVWGVPKVIHVDNASEFRSNNFGRSCLQYSIHIEYRVVKQPRYGGHIERLLGTFLRELHSLPGTTFSSIKAREGYDSEKHAAMTRNELEEWMVTYICKVYHQSFHSGLGMSPAKKWELGIFGGGGQDGVGVPPRPVDRMTILLDFLPAFYRTIQTFGVSIDGLTYYAEALRPWIGSVDPATGKTRELVFRRDPRDISAIWFFDPEIRQYFKIPFADQSLPAMSIWEYQQSQELRKKQGATTTKAHSHEVLRAITELRNQVDLAAEKTKKARRQAQKRREHEKKISPATPIPDPQPNQTQTRLDIGSELVDGDVEDFGTIE